MEFDTACLFCRRRKTKWSVSRWRLRCDIIRWRRGSTLCAQTRIRKQLMHSQKASKKWQNFKAPKVLNTFFFNYFAPYYSLLLHAYIIALSIWSYRPRTPDTNTEHNTHTSYSLSLLSKVFIAVTMASCTAYHWYSAFAQHFCHGGHWILLLLLPGYRTPDLGIHRGLLASDATRSSPPPLGRSVDARGWFDVIGPWYGRQSQPYGCHSRLPGRHASSMSPTSIYSRCCLWPIW